MNDENKLSTVALCNVLRFIGEDDGVSKNVELEQTDSTEDEVELAFSFGRCRYYLRVRKADIARLAKLEADHG